MAEVLAGQMLTPGRLVPAVVHQWRLRTVGKGLKHFEGYHMTERSTTGFGKPGRY